MKKPGAGFLLTSARRLAVCSAWIVCGLGLLGTVAAREALPSADAIQSMREDLQERQRERESREAPTHVAPWRPLTQGPDARFFRDRAAVRMVNRAVAFRAVWILEPVDIPEARPVRALLGWQGEDWITLTPGDWRVRLIVGQPGGQGLAQPAQEVHAERGKAYELAIPSEAEPTLRKQARAAAEADRVKSAPAEARPASSAGRDAPGGRPVKRSFWNKMGGPKIPGHLGR